MPSIIGRRFGALITIIVVGVLLFGLTVGLTILQTGIHGFAYRTIRDVQDLKSAIEPPPLYLVESMLIAHEIIDAKEIGPLVVRLRELEASFTENEHRWMQRMSSAEARQSLEEMGRPAHRFIDATENDFLPAIMRKDRVGAVAALDGPMAADYNAHRLLVISLLDRLQRLRGEEEGHAGLMLMIGGSCMAIILISLLAAGWGMLRVRQVHMRELKDRESRLVLLAAAAFEGIVLTDGLRVVDANQQMVLMLGASNIGDLTGKSILEFIDVDNRPMFLSRLSDRSEADCELAIRRGDRSKIEVEVRSRFHAADGGSVRLLAFRDVTSNKQAQRELINFRNHLQDLVVERTAELELARRTAESASYEAAKANRAKSEFLANMSHEIRTPLNAVLGYSQMLKRDVGLDAKIRSAVEVISRSGEHLLTLISDILEMSRIESGRSTCDLAACDLHELLKSMKSLFLLRARDKGLELHLVIASEVPRYVQTDARKVRQILANLISNAVRFTQTGQVSMVANYQEGRLRVEVIDTGMGIGAEEIKILFQPFVQVKSSRTRGEGTGLGLSISRGLTEVLGGQLTVTSVEAEGSSFVLSIPVSICPQTAKGAAQAAQVEEQLRTRPDRPCPRVLIAEDHVDSRNLLRDLMSSIGVEVREVGNGADAIACAATWQPDLIWMDIDMPHVDGLAAVRAIRASATGKVMVIIALTAAAFSEDRDLILEAGCDEVSHKPYDEAVLFALMERLLQGRFIRIDVDGGISKALLQISDTRLRSIVSALPASKREFLHQALIIGDLSSIEQACAEWPDKEAAEAMGQLAMTLNLDRLMKVIEPSPIDQDPGGRP